MLPCSPKSEPSWLTNKHKRIWTNESTLRLIEAIESECRELWDNKHPSYKDRVVRQARLGFLAGMFGTTMEEIGRKVHNLRTQFNSEIRKIKKRKQTCGEECGASSWEYFEPLSFLLAPGALDVVDSLSPGALDVGVSLSDSMDSVECGAADINALAEFQEAEAAVFRVRPPADPSPASPPPDMKRPMPMMWFDPHAPAPPTREERDEPIPRIFTTNRADECQIFGDFVASELRMLKSDESRKKLKRIVQKAILRVGEDEDGFLR